MVCTAPPTMYRNWQYGQMVTFCNMVKVTFCTVLSTFSIWRGSCSSSTGTHLTQSIIWGTKAKQEDMSMWVSGSEHAAIWWPLCIEHCSMALTLNEVLKWCNRIACKDVPNEDLPIMTCTKQNVCVKRVRFQDKHLILVTSQNLYQLTCNSNQPS